MKFGSKGGAKVAAPASTKLVAKIASKMSVKWVPILGGIIGAGINVWIMGGLMDAAEKYYSNDYVVLSDELASDIE